MMRRLALAVLALPILFAATPALAHKMKVFAAAEGATISGYAYFNGDSRAIGSRVKAVGADGRPVFEGRTDEQGRFAFPVAQRMDYRITVDGDDGHAASFTIAAAELPDGLPAPDGAAPVPAAAPPSAAIPQPAAGDDLRAFVEQSVSRQIRPLREQIDAYQEKIWWHDVIGGIGYIVGLAGLAFGWASRRPPRGTKVP
jgi:nickel transport protein